MSNDNNNQKNPLDAASATGAELNEMNTMADSNARSQQEDIEKVSSPTDVAYPINFRLERTYNDQNAVLYEDFTWDPSTGIRGELGSCQIKAVITYPGGNPFNPEDSPPFGKWGWPNPTIEGPVPGHYHGLTVKSYCDKFIKDYTPASFTTTVKFYYRQSWWPADKFEQIPITNNGDSYKIERSVYQEANGKWKYRVQGLGGSVIAPI